jgi:hypothetical protein
MVRYHRRPVRRPEVRSRADFTRVLGQYVDHVLTGPPIFGTRWYERQLRALESPLARFYSQLDPDGGSRLGWFIPQPYVDRMAIDAKRLFNQRMLDLVVPVCACVAAVDSTANCIRKSSSVPLQVSKLLLQDAELAECMWPLLELIGKRYDAVMQGFSPANQPPEPAVMKGFLHPADFTSGINDSDPLFRSDSRPAAVRLALLISRVSVSLGMTVFSAAAVESGVGAGVSSVRYGMQAPDRSPRLFIDDATFGFVYGVEHGMPAALSLGEGTAGLAAVVATSMAGSAAMFDFIDSRNRRPLAAPPRAAVSLAAGDPPKRPNQLPSPSQVPRVHSPGTTDISRNVRNDSSQARPLDLGGGDL